MDEYHKDGLISCGDTIYLFGSRKLTKKENTGKFLLILSS
jgi:hypothetical protein